MRGMRQAVSGSGVPQIVVTIMLWRWSRLTKIWPTVPASCASHALPGVARLSNSAIFPVAPARAKSAGFPSPTSTTSASSPSVDVENACVRPSIMPPSGSAIRPSSGRLISASISRRSTT